MTDQPIRIHRARVRFTAEQLARMVVLPSDTRVVTAVADPVCGTVDVIIEGDWLPYVYAGSEPPAWELPLRNELEPIGYVTVATDNDGALDYVTSRWHTLPEARAAARRIRENDEDAGVNPIVCALVPVPEDAA